MQLASQGSLDRSARFARGWAATVWIYFATVGGIWAVIKFGRSIGLEGTNAFALVWLLAGLPALMILGPGAPKETFGRFPEARWICVGLLLGLASFVVSFFWVSWSWDSGTLGFDLERRWNDSAVGEWLLRILVISYLEELVFRGALWAALCRTSKTMLRPILQTATLFAICHIVNGGEWLELPHRFVAGLLFGWLRARSGSLWPSVWAHVIANFAAGGAI